MAISIVHVGLPLDHPVIPVGERAKLAARLAALEQRMRAAGYAYRIAHVSPEHGLDEFLATLRNTPCDGVLVGGGV